MKNGVVEKGDFVNLSFDLRYRCRLAAKALVKQSASWSQDGTYKLLEISQPNFEITGLMFDLSRKDCYPISLFKRVHKVGAKVKIGVEKTCPTHYDMKEILIQYKNPKRYY